MPTNNEIDERLHLISVRYPCGHSVSGFRAALATRAGVLIGLACPTCEPDGFKGESDE